MADAIRYPGMPAHLRRTLRLLEWIASEEPAARVFSGATLLGTWRDLQPRWQFSGAHLYLRLSTPGGPVGFRMASFRRTRNGIQLLPATCHGSSPGRWAVRWGEGDPEPGDPDLVKYIVGWMRRAYPGSICLSVSNRPDLANSLSGKFLRILFRRCGRECLVMAALPSTSAEEAQLGVTHALLWMNLLKRNGRIRSRPDVHILVPAGAPGALRHRAAHLSRARVRMRVWEYGGVGEEFEVRRPARLEAPLENRDFRWPLLGAFQWSPQLAQVLDLAPGLIRRYPRFQDYDSLRLAGLEFARACGAARDRIVYGIGPEQVELTADTAAGLAALVREITYFRRPDTPDPRHPYYRLQAERWLETLILESVPELFPELIPEAVYSQIPVYLGQSAGRVDILGVDRDGTLVVMELKVGPDPHLPVQGLDYWARVIAHNKNGDFERRGYFSAVPVKRSRPKIYLIAPLFSFHDSTERIMSCLNADIEMWKIGINVDWRCGVKILRRVRYRCGDLL